MYLLDTNILSETVKPRPVLAVMRTLTHTSRSLRFASEITRYEMRFGARLLDDGGKLWTRIERDVLPLADWLPVDKAVALRAADLGAMLRRAGQPLGTDRPLACRDRARPFADGRHPQHPTLRTRTGSQYPERVPFGLTPGTSST